ncbi:mesencephalic astrocyte-derived neurotrophic factor-like [Acipenser ruthenus]|uniref:mesencephalic astrocyte-derived neurotrophic factor-like n=1 Tax=Acipenser ruthenus TaxID=7906 RepID=UPI002741F5D1|nr:mesencephalic astrocyte-derived neurotrophic factor-like [Acipenser ruthenus]
MVKLIQVSQETFNLDEVFKVCIGFLGRFYQTLKAKPAAFTPVIVEKELILACRYAKGKENRLFYYLGATSDAATKMTSEVTRPMSSHVPVQKICEKLQKKDSEICELRYVFKLEFLKKSSHWISAELKSILDSWEEMCKACIEKKDFVNLIQELAPKYTSRDTASSQTCEQHCALCNRVCRNLKDFHIFI